MKLPEAIIEEFDDVVVVRDDLLEGGSKRRYVYEFLSLVDCNEWVYASPACGYAQVSLAFVCNDLNKRSTVFVPERSKIHEYTELALQNGAKVVQVPMGYLSNLKSKASAYVDATKGAALVPFGFDHSIVVKSVAAFARTLPVEPKEVWTAISSGVLSRGLQAAWPKARVFGVRVGHATTKRESGRAKLFIAPETFAKPAKVRPPFPSCANYDAKVWQFIKKHASPGALFWNVAA